MRADDLHQAVVRVAGILDEAGIRQAVDRFRSSRGDDLTVAAARLGHAGALVSERFQKLEAAERRVVKSLHLDALASTSYWQQLIEASPATTAASPAGRAEIIKLAARLMFAAQNLPGLTSLLRDVEPAERLAGLASGESRLLVRLVDAGERASSPDRIARAIDGIDMLYSACASIARRPAMDLRLDAIDGSDSRDIRLTGGRDAVAAVVAVMTSIPVALRSIDEDDDIDLDALVGSLPVFSDLQTLASMGSFSQEDLSNISETMRQGALLVLESGIALVPDDAAGSAEGEGSSATGDGEPRSAAADRHYEAYLREREAMSGTAGNDGDHVASSADGQPVSAVQAGEINSVDVAKARLGATVGEDRAHRVEVERMLSTLKDQRGHH